MNSAISVRLDEKALRALALIEASGLSRSEAIRTSLIARAEQLHRFSELKTEMAELEADEDDRKEMQEIAAFMETLRAEG